jgi:threonine dehydratase
MAGNGTIGLEILEDLPDVDAVVIPWGGGGLASGIGAALRALKPGCRVYAAEAASGAPLSAALAAGVPRVVEYRASFVDGIGSRSVFPQMLERARAVLDGALVCTLEEIAGAVRLLADAPPTAAGKSPCMSLLPALASVCVLRFLPKLSVRLRVCSNGSTSGSRSDRLEESQ